MTESAAVPAARQPNERLLSLIREAGCSNAGLARRVNVCAAERGLDFRYDKTSVARWIRGQRPRGRAPEVIAEALGRKLGRTVTLQEIGMGGSRQPPSAVGLTFAPGLLEAIEEARELWRADSARPQPTGTGQTPAGGAAVAPGALVEPSRDWLIARIDDSVAAPAGTGRVGMSDVEAVIATTEAMVELDRRWGAGHVRPVVAHYLNGVVAGLLTGSYRESVGRRLFAAAARLTELAGYMAVDTGQPGLAQRYYIQALRLSQAAGDRGFGGYVLAAGMSHLAAQLGSPREVIQLARAAQEGTRGQVPPRAEALFLAAEARGHAQLGDREACRRAASPALAAMERAGGSRGEDPDWVAHYDSAYLADELAHCHRDLEQGNATQQRASEALAGHPESRTRRRAIGLLVLATGKLQQAEVEHACQTAGEAGVLLTGLRSRRGSQYFADFNARLAPYQDTPHVKEFQERWRGAAPALV
ncbi:transcriptional regulator [Streptomyces lonarensis]|uniref:Transcriptional regulator n=1 Tax=Streptomyces lonarensis TaxID=700599 RepID=A0A7X6I0W5_9ACTN|nr:transcriptional regulator [Streptomyces lonarensis]NJQ07935.1 transcriptional regulator [Streptomyces lonarensis]